MTAGDDNFSRVERATVSVVMPAFNEEATVEQALRAVLAQSCVAEVIAVDDASTDRTWEILQRWAAEDSRVQVRQHLINQGKGAALRTGFRVARSPIVLIQDADLEYNPKEYARVLEPIFQDRADVVFGSRFMGSDAHRVLYFWHYAGNVFLTLLSNMATNLNLSDMETGMKAFRREVVQQIEITENRFGFEVEITARVAQLGVRIYETAISYDGRTYAQGKKIGWRDGVRALYCIVKYNFFNRLKSGPPPGALPRR